MCTPNLRDFHALFTRCAHSTHGPSGLFAEGLTLGKKQKTAVKEERKKKHRGRDTEVRVADTDRSWGRKSWSLDTYHPHPCRSGVVVCLEP